MFSLRPGWSLGFTHAVLTTGDKPKTVASVGGEPLEASAAMQVNVAKRKSTLLKQAKTRMCCTQLLVIRLLELSSSKYQTPRLLEKAVRVKAPGKAED